MVKKKKLSRKNKAMIRLFFSFLVFGSIIGYLSYNFFSKIDKILEIREEKQLLENKLVGLQNEQNELKSDIKKLEDPEYVARYAREKYMYSKDGEIIIRIPDSK